MLIMINKIFLLNIVKSSVWAFTIINDFLKSVHQRDVIRLLLSAEKQSYKRIKETFLFAFSFTSHACMYKLRK